MFDQSDNVTGHGPIGVEGHVARISGSAEASEVWENHTSICSQERGDDSRASFGGRIRQGRSPAESFDKKLLPFFKNRQNQLEISELPKGINSIPMQKDDGRTLAFVMISDGSAVERCESLQRNLKRMQTSRRSRPENRSPMCKGIASLQERI